MLSLRTDLIDLAEPALACFEDFFAADLADLVTPDFPDFAAVLPLVFLAAVRFASGFFFST
jgi:hypothetical protein